MAPTKQQLRREMKARRAAMTPNDVARASDVIRRHLLELDLVQQAASIFVYVSMNNEPDTHALIRDLLALGKVVCVPRLDPTGHMRAHRITSLDNLVHGDPTQFNIPVPPSESPSVDHPQVAVVPGLAFTPTGRRLGQGGGHYDRYLADHPDTVPVGLSYAWQRLDDLPHEPHDRTMHVFVTEQGVISCAD